MPAPDTFIDSLARRDSRFLAVSCAAAQERDPLLHQYHFGAISIPPASADEPAAKTLSFDRAIASVEGGWSIRSFSAPEQWGRGNRAERLRAETGFGDPPSDGHQTGLAIVVLSSAGVPPPHPSWGRMLQEGAHQFLEVAPWLTIFPGLALTLAIFSFALFGDALRDALDPRLSVRGLRRQTRPTPIEYET